MWLVRLPPPLWKEGRASTEIVLIGFFLSTIILLLRLEKRGKGWREDREKRSIVK